MVALNYAKEYSYDLAQAYPYTLNFGDLYATPNNGRYRWTGSKTIEIPTISTTGRVDSNRDTIAVAQRNYDNAWEPKVLTNQRKWSTLVHPADINQTNYVASIGNITKVYNEEQKFPEMDAYCISKIYADWTALGNTADTTVLTTTNVLEVFDKLMEKMNLLGLLPWALSRAVPVVLGLSLGTAFVQGIVDNMPLWLMGGLKTAGQIVPALGIAILLKYLSIKKYVAYLLIGFALAAYLGVPMLGISFVGLALALMTYERRQEGTVSIVGGGDDEDE